MLPILCYDPPYPTPAEDELAWHLVKYLRDDCALTYDGRVFTVTPAEGQPFTVRVRDAPSAAGPDYSLTTDDITRRLHACLLEIARQEPGTFSERGRLNLITLASL